MEFRPPYWLWLVISPTLNLGGNPLSIVTNHTMNRQNASSTLRCQSPILPLTCWLGRFIVHLMLLLNFSITFMGTKAPLCDSNGSPHSSVTFDRVNSKNREWWKTSGLLLIMTCNLFSLRPIMRGGAWIRCRTSNDQFRYSACHLVERILSGSIDLIKKNIYI